MLRTRSVDSAPRGPPADVSSPDMLPGCHGWADLGSRRALLQGRDALLVGPTIPGTGITAFRTSSSACSDPTKGAEFDGTGQVFGETEMVNFTVAVCDNGPAGSGLDFFSFSAPSINYSKSATLTSGEIAKSTGSSSAGSLVVSTNTSGTSLPASGYTATVDGATSQPIGITSIVTFY